MNDQKNNASKEHHTATSVEITVAMTFDSKDSVAFARLLQQLEVLGEGEFVDAVDGRIFMEEKQNPLQELNLDEKVEFGRVVAELAAKYLGGVKIRRESSLAGPRSAVVELRNATINQKKGGDFLPEARFTSNDTLPFYVSFCFDLPDNLSATERNLLNRKLDSSRMSKAPMLEDYLGQQFRTACAVGHRWILPGEHKASTKARISSLSHVVRPPMGQVPVAQARNPAAPQLVTGGPTR